MGPIPQLASSQYRPPQPDTNPNVRRTMPQRKERGKPLPRGLGLAQPPNLVE